MTCESEDGAKTSQYTFGNHTFKKLPDALEVNYISPKIKKKRKREIVETENQTYSPSEESINTKRLKKKHKAKQNVGEEICKEGTVLDKTYFSNDESLKQEVMPCESEDGAKTHQYAFGDHTFKKLPDALEVNYTSPKIKKKRKREIVETENQTYSPNDESINTKRLKKKHKHKAKPNVGEEICKEGTVLDKIYFSNDESLKQEVITCESEDGAKTRQYAFGNRVIRELPNVLEVNYTRPSPKRKLNIVETENQTYFLNDESLNTKRLKKKHKHKAKEEICNEGTVLNFSNDESLKQEVMTCESEDVAKTLQYAVGDHSFKEFPTTLEMNYTSPKIKKKTKKLSADQKPSSLDIDPGNDESHYYLEKSVKENDHEKAKKKKKHKESKVA